MGIACALLGVLACLIIPLDANSIPKMSLREASHRLNLIGASIGILGLLVFNFAWNQAPSVGWQNAQVISTLCIGIVLLVVFLCYEANVAANPLLPWPTFSSQASFVLACIAGGWSSFGVLLYYYFRQVQVIEGESSLLASVHFIPAIFSGFLAAFITGQIINRIPPSILMTISMIVFLVGSLLLATRPTGQIYWAQIFVATLITPLGMDMCFPAGTLLLSDFMPPEHQGLAASLVTTVVNYSISIGLGIAGTVESYTNDDGTKTREGIANARWSGVALAATALVVSLFYCLVEVLEKGRKAKPQDVERFDNVVPDSEKIAEESTA